MRTVMTLNEYLNQKDPERMPLVKLTPNCYTMGHVRKCGRDLHRSVWIKALGGVEYCKVNNISGLYTTDRDGNPKNRSCFNV